CHENRGGYSGSGLLSTSVSSYTVPGGDVGRCGMLGRSVAVYADPSHRAKTGTIPSIFLAGALATRYGRVPLSGVPARPAAPVVLGTAVLVWYNGCQWLHFVALCGRTLLAPSTAVGCSNPVPVTHLWVFPRPLHEYISRYSAACVL